MDGVDVGTGHLRLFGRHVFGRADQLPLEGEDLLLGQRLRRRLRDPEVDDLGLGLRPVGIGDQDVSRLEVSVDDPLLVGMLDAVADAGEQIKSLLQIQLLLVAILVQRNPPNQFRHEVRSSVAPASKIFAIDEWSMTARA